MRVLNQVFDQQLQLEERASALLAGGIMQHGYQCGMIWGAVLAAGARAYELFGPGPEAETRAIMAAQRLVDTFQTCTGEINCFEITDIDKSSSIMKMIYVFLIKGKTLSCIRLSAQYAPIAFKEINAAFSEKIITPQKPQVSCAAMLARKMGASEKHTVMAAGLAGGIGLCGGACGALGAAIWIMTMDKGLDSKIDFKDSKALDLIERFLKSSGNEFECSEIVGRKFENIDDHVRYMQDGGCSKIIEDLTATGVEK